MLELIKNSYDADALECRVSVDERRIRVSDSGTGMTLDEFTNGWMRIGTSSKEAKPTSRKFGRPITGEKGIGRFAVRYLGQKLVLATVARDESIATTTRLVAVFDWVAFDRKEDLGAVRVPYRLSRVPDDTPTGTVLSISRLRSAASDVDWKELRTGSMGVVSTLRSLLQEMPGDVADSRDPGFSLIAGPPDADADVALEVLKHYALRAKASVEGDVVRIDILKGGSQKPYLSIVDSVDSELDGTTADIRFFPRRAGLFSDVGVDGRKAYTWIRENSGVKVFDRGFQMRPYGMAGDDWLALAADTERNLREPASAVMRKHYPMPQAVKSSTSLNWMLRLPSNPQLVGVVQVRGRRISEGQESGLVAAADREGFIENQTFADFTDLVRGMVEAMAYADREISLEEERRAAEAKIAEARARTQATIREIEGETAFTPQQRDRVIGILQETQARSERLRMGEKEREQQLEIMSLLGVVAGFMTHEFGVALSELRTARDELKEIAAEVPGFAEKAKAFDDHIDAPQGFVRYSRAYIEGVRTFADKPYLAKPRFMHVAKAFSDYAGKRRIEVRIEVEPDVEAPSVPPALYDGIAQNLLTNALKSLTSSDNDEKAVVFRAWNDGRWHRMQVSDTGSGIPPSIRDLVFDPLFTTTNRKSSDPLGSGMGLGLALVRRGAKAFGGTAELVEPPPRLLDLRRSQFPARHRVTMTTPAHPILLLIDDDPDQSARLKEQLARILEVTGAEMNIVNPVENDVTRDLLTKILEMRPTLVVTDHDLTAKGPAGLMGDTIIAWCRTNAIPVGDYSRKLEADLEEPDIFEFRFSKEADQAAPEIAELLLGFHALAGLVGAKPDNGTSWSRRLAELLGHPSVAASFSLYSARTGATHATVIERLESRYGDDAKGMLSTYVLGHLLKNGILRYPGPLVGGLELCSYLAIDDKNVDALVGIFNAARYDGPFGRFKEYYWHETVDEVLVDLAEKHDHLELDLDDDTHRRAVMAKLLDPGHHTCGRCGGDRGGYRCPYTNRTVCNRPDCSVPTSSWIPPGAYLTRVEKDYYDQWSPLLGL